VKAAAPPLMQISFPMAWIPAFGIAIVVRQGLALLSFQAVVIVFSLVEVMQVESLLALPCFL
jgi:hypothetical protein